MVFATTNMAVGRGGAMTADMAMEESAMYPPMPYGEGGDDAEEYERRNYNARYETRKFEETCTAIADLKPLEYVVFDNSNKGEDWCSYNFRVDVEHEDEVVAALKELNPKDFSIDTSTLERSIEYNDSELALQQRRIESLQDTLAQAENSFNSLITQAERAGDTSTLSDVINNKINTLDRLNQEILNTQDRIDRLTRNQEGQVEQIEYAHFYTSVQKVTYLDSERLGDIWKQRVKEMVNEVNETFLALTVGLITFILNVVQFIIFATVLVISTAFVARVLWVIVKRIWGRTRSK